ncbi:hypothetical protein ANO11243_046210 [Dothideomycetidae sp. 11243]|nr:hypothetical protein ANO11243_046210 [fungal sp. No.11243]
MAENKKKKKSVANPARGFATTSISSKPRPEQPEKPPTIESNANSRVQTGNATPEQNSTQIASTSIASLDNRDLKDLTSEELEAQLERSELQQLVEQHASKVRRDATRQVSRLETDRRLLRGQAEILTTSTWLPEHVSARIMGLLQSSGLRGLGIAGPRSTKASLHEESLLAQVWVLQLVLRDINLSTTLTTKAIEHILSSRVHGLDETSGMIWGLSETFEWLALHADEEWCDYYESQKPQVVISDTSESHDIIRHRLQQMDTPKKASSTKSTNKGREAVTSNGAMAAAIEEPDVTFTDSDSDSDPDQMLAKYVEYKLRLFEHDAEKFGDLRPSIKNSESVDYTSGQAKLVRRLNKMETDPLFDIQAADIVWREKRTQAFHNQDLAKRQDQNAKNADADEASTDAEELAADILKVAPEDDDAGLFATIFDVGTETSDNAPQAALTTGSNPVTLRTFAKIEGYSPRRILEETCKARDQGCRLRIEMISETTYSCRHSVLIQWSRDQEVKVVPFLSDLRLQCTNRAFLLEMVDVAASGVEQSEGFACTSAFFAIFAGSSKEEKAALRMPPSFRDLYQEFVTARQEWSDSSDRQTIQSIRSLIERHRNDVEDQDVVLVSAFKNRSKQTSGTTTPALAHDSSSSSISHRADLQAMWARKTESIAYQTMLQLRMDLPMYRFRAQALEAIRQNQVTILCGETGCGKSTQMPAFILEEQLSQGIPCRIYCTEPRRISAVSLAQRVSEELGEEKNAVGTAKSLVGYAIRLESQAVSSTRLIYATVGIVLRMLESQDGLKDLTHLIIDEVHERSIDTDFLLIVLKTLLLQRPDLKVVLMSATVDATRFSKYLGDAPIITVPGRTFPVRDFYLEDAIELTGHTTDDNQSARVNATEDDDSDTGRTSSAVDATILSKYSNSTIKTLANLNEYRIDYVLIIRLLELVAQDPTFAQFSPAVLVFLPGIAEIRQLADMLTGHPVFSKGWLLYPLHSTFSNEEQQAAFKVPPAGMRKIVLATNIAETGITIPDVTCVIDAGKHKEMRFDEKRQLSRLVQSFISRANAKQRRGRAGRVQEGICFHLFTRDRHDKLMAEQQLPEMLRLSLQDLIIRVKICKLGDVESALSQALDPPSVKNIRRAIDALTEVGALTAGEDLTAMGQQIAKLPLDAQLGKLIILGHLFGCLDFALTTAAIASSKSPFLAPMNAKRQADTVRLGFKRGDSDLLTSYNAYTTWRRVCTSAGMSEYEFCKKNFLSQQNLANVEELKGQLLSALADANLITLSEEDRLALLRIRRTKRGRAFISVPSSATYADGNDSLIAAVVAWAFYPKILIREGKGWRSAANNQMLSLHPTSVNALSPKPEFLKAKYLSFHSIMQSSSRFTNAQETTPVEAMPLVLLSGDARFDFYSGVIIIDGNRLRFKVRTWREMALLKALRIKIKSILARAWKRPGRDMTDSEKEWFTVLADMFEAWNQRKLKERS